MLTKDELMAECHKIFNALPDRGETIDGVDDAVLKLNKQASQAIDLAAENEQLRAEIAEYKETFYEQGKSLGDRMIECDQLKTKLDAVREWCIWHRQTCDASDILEIIDKDGDE